MASSTSPLRGLVFCADLIREIFRERIAQAPEPFNGDEAMLFWLFQDRIRTAIEGWVRKICAAYGLTCFDPETEKRWVETIFQEMKAECDFRVGTESIDEESEAIPN